MFAGRFHAASHGADVGITAATDILEIEYKNIDPAQHRRGRFARRAVQRVRNQSCHGIAPRADITPGFFSAVEPMLWCIERDEITIFSQQHARPHTFGIDSGLVGDQTDAFSSEQRIIVIGENIDAELDRGTRHRSRRQHYKERDEAFFVSGGAHRL